MRLRLLYPLLAISSAGAQQPTSLAAARLRSLYFQQAYPDGFTEGASAAKRFANSPEVRAWFITNYSAAGFTDQAIDSARAVTRQFPRSPWSAFAVAFALSQDFERGKEAMPLARRAFGMSPRNADFVLLNATVQQRYGRYAEAIAFLDSVMPRFAPSAELLAAKGSLLAARSRERDADTTLRRRARETFVAAQRLQPDNVNAWYQAVVSVDAPRGDTAAFTMLEHAAKLSPFSTTIHSRYWSAVQSLRSLSDSAKRSIVESDIERLLAARRDHPAFLYAASNGYGTIKLTDKQRELRERLLRDFRQTRYAELALYAQLDDFADSTRKTLADLAHPATSADSLRLRAEHRRRTREFIARPYHFSRSLLGTVYLDLFASSRQDSTVVSDAELLAAIRGMVRYNTMNPTWTHYEAPLLLAERKLDPRLAAKLATESVEKWAVPLDGLAKFLPIGELADARDNVNAQHHDLLGWIAFHSGRVAEAERELERARAIFNRSSLVYYHLGRVAEATGRLDAAEQSYARGYQLETSSFGRRRENENALKRIFTGKHGSLAGFDAYVEQLKEADRQHRREMIAGRIIKDRKQVPSFSLERLTLDTARASERVSSDVLKGKIGVVNFWGVWCGPCVAEMPELQKVHDRFKGDTDVVFLTVDYNDAVSTVRSWMTQRKFTMPVLLDDGYVSNTARIRAYPTTWFIDRDGRIAFAHSGASDVVLEEFTWRVEMLKAGAAKPAAVP